MEQEYKQSIQTIGSILTSINSELETRFNEGEYVSENTLNELIESFGVSPKLFKGRSHIAIEIDEVLQVKAKRKNIASVYNATKSMSYTQLIIIFENSADDAQSKTYEELIQMRECIKDIKKEKEESLKEKRLNDFLEELNSKDITTREFKEVLKAYESLSYMQKMELENVFKSVNF